MEIAAGRETYQHSGRRITRYVETQYQEVYLRFVPEQQLAEASMLCGLDPSLKEALGMGKRNYPVDRSGETLRYEQREFRVCKSLRELEELKEYSNVTRNDRN